MFRFITETFHRLIEELPPLPTRYLYPKFHLGNRLTGLVGPRGVGKTTLLLQYIKNELLKKKNCFYFSADLVYFQQANLLEFVDDLHRKEGYQTVFIDEIHKYRGWDQELKNIYDSFPSLKIVFSGSSMLDLVSGGYDLSRRAKLYHLRGLSFREYLNFSQNLTLSPFSLDELLKEHKSIELPKILTHFENYLAQGYYPFVFEDPHSYHEKTSRIIEKTIFEDIANFYNLKTPNLQYFKKILVFLASIPPGELNIQNLAQNLQIDHKTAQHYLQILGAVGLVRELHPHAKGSRILKKPSKYFLNNTTLMHTMQQYVAEPILKGTERELFFIQSLENAEIPVFCSSQGDFQTREALFEIGGKHKSNKQLKGATLPSYLIKDQILTAIRNEIPLHLFGFLY